MRNKISLMIGMSALFVSAAHAVNYDVACQRPGDVRLITIVSPGEIGKTCV